MNNLFTPTDYDYMIGRTIREESLNDEELYNFFDNICEEVSKLVWLESKLKSEIIRRELQYYKDEKNGIYRVEKCKRRYIFNDRER